MPPDSPSLDALKYILENARHPARLDDHPWAHSLLAAQPSQPAGGQALVQALIALFRESMPALPPRQGKRLDTRWGEFGLLAAQYFAPLVFGAPAPASLREAWGRIDQSILLFVYGRPVAELSAAERDAYKLVGDEPEVAAHSTLSDWHRKGLQRLMDAVLAREAYLAKTLARPALIVAHGSELLPATPAPRRALPWIVVVLVILALGLAAAWKGRQVYLQAMRVREDVSILQQALRSPGGRLQQARLAAPALATLRADFASLKLEVEPFTWLGPWLGWVPEYGGELSQAQDLLIYADSLLTAADGAVSALAPALEPAPQGGISLERLIGVLHSASPQLLDARTALESALAARARLDPERLSPRVRDVILTQVDPQMTLVRDALTLAVELPRVLGATEEGPKTYLLLALNEDELRPSGGFITAAGTVLLQNGRPGEIQFQNSGDLEDWNKPYPAAPWQLLKYMDSPVLIFRDTTWFADYRQTALYAEQLYSYVSGHSVDGVIAFDQQFLAKLLEATGPLQVESQPEPITSANVFDALREIKRETMDDFSNPERTSKPFINDIGRALMNHVFAGDVDWERLLFALADALAERNLLIQMDNPTLTEYLARQNWDGALRPQGGDFLLVADSNIGFNKTSAVMTTRLDYAVDLTSRLSPRATLRVLHQNTAPKMYTCKQVAKDNLAAEQRYRTSDCYWNYMRVYRPAGTSLVSSVAQFVPANWLWSYASVPPRVDVLGSEDMPDVEAFGTLMVIPGGQEEQTEMHFSLPVGIIQSSQSASNLWAYRLKVQKQPGARPQSLKLTVSLPPGAVIYSVPDGSSLLDGQVIFETGLRRDVNLEILFYLP